MDCISYKMSPEILKAFLLVVINTSLVLSQKPTVSSSKDNGIQELLFVASAEGKSFFAEPTPLRTWDQAKARCKEVGLEQATINSDAQYEALVNAGNSSVGIRGEYWTAARDAHLLRQFSWDGTDSQPGSFLNYSRQYGTWTCTSGITLNIDKKAGYEHHFGFLFHNPHSKEWGTLCQTPISKW